MSSDSSSDEDLDKFQEAVDENFFTKDLYSDDKSKKNVKSLTKPMKSCRNQVHQEVFSNPLNVKVTPEFQAHVAKHLSNLLDEAIDDTKIIIKSRKITSYDSNGGVKLLSSSKDYLKLGKNTLIIHPKYFYRENLSDRDYRKRAKEVAVTADWVLSQEETKFWAPNTKGEVEVIK